VQIQGPDLQTILSATYALLMISGTYDKTYDNGRGVLRKSDIVTENQNKLFDAKLPYWFSLSAI